MLPPALTLSGLITSPLPTKDGYSWTLPSRLGHMLRLAEAQFGPRDSTYTLLGIEYTVEAIPQIWYPNNCKHIVIQLTLPCLGDMVRGCFQLAHDCIHLLSPLGGRHATNLEEGLATHFAHWYMLHHFGATYSTELASYEQARTGVEALLAIDPFAIKRLRQTQFVISHITADLLLQDYPTLPESVALQLAQPFQR